MRRTRTYRSFFARLLDQSLGVSQVDVEEVDAGVVADPVLDHFLQHRSRRPQLNLDVRPTLVDVVERLADFLQFFRVCLIQLGTAKGSSQSLTAYQYI